MHRFLWLFAALLYALASPAHAEWRQARTDHFVLTINDTEEGARDFATRLERFDAALRRIYGLPDNPDQHARPITIYALDADLFQKVCGCIGALGYYRPRAETSLIFSMHMPSVDRKAKTGGWSSQTVLLHEYSHHFAYSNFPIAYPYWFSEGFAEFNANASFEADGSIIIGYPAHYRGEALKGGSSLSPRQLFEPHRYGYGNNIDLLYGRGWLLTHYLMLNPRRNAQLAAYLSAMNKGKQSLAAAEEAFGDLKKLNAELDTYLKGYLAAPLRVPPTAAGIKVAVTALSPGQAAMLPVHALVRSGVGKHYRLGVALRAAKIAARYPDDAVVQSQLAETEYLAGRLNKADEAADAALKLKPDLVDALVRKGMIAIQRANEAKTSAPAVWEAARAWLLKANRISPNEVAPLYLYYLSFLSAKAEPTPGAIRGLMRAQVLAPESREVRAALARQMLLNGDAASARFLLQPIAFAPHRASTENVARQVVDLIDAGKIDEAKAAITKGEKDQEEE
jgi:tetratricopeptide (TPR) repeat protein